MSARGSGYWLLVVAGLVVGATVIALLHGYLAAHPITGARA